MFGSDATCVNWNSTEQYKLLSVPGNENGVCIV